MLLQSLLAHYNVEEHWKVSGGRGHLLHLLVWYGILEFNVPLNTV